MRVRNISAYILSLGLLFSGCERCSRVMRLVEVGANLKYGLKEFYTDKEKTGHYQEFYIEMRNFHILINKRSLEKFAE